MATAPSPNHLRQQETKKHDVISPAEESKTRLEFKSIALKGLFIIACFYTLYFTRALIMPFALAFLLNFLLRPVVRALKRIKIPELIGAAMVLIALLGIVGYGVIKLSKPAAEWMEEAPERLQKIELKVDFLRKPVERVNKAAEALKKIMTMGVEHVAEVEIKHPGFADTILTGTQEVLAKSSVMFVLLFFLLASGDMFVRRLIRLFPGLGKKKRIVKITRAVENQISRYLFTVTVINLFMGIAVGIGMFLIGMPNPVLWGVMAGFFVFLPYLGPLIGITIVTVVAFLTFDAIGRMLLAPAIYIALETIQGQVITPMVVGIRFALNPVAIFIWIIFWGWLWGVIGALLAVPMLTVFKIFCDHIEPLAPMGEFLGK